MYPARIHSFLVNYKLQDYLIPVSNKVVRWFKLKSTLVKIYQERNNELLGIFLIVLAILLGISFYFKATGLVGRILTQGFKVILGNGAYIVPFVFLMWGINLVRDKEFKITGRSIGLCLLFLVILTLFHFESGTKLEFKFALQGRGGGLVGAVILYILRRSLEDLGAYIVLGAVSLIGMLLATDLFLSTLVKQITEYFMELSVKFKNKLNQFKKKLIPEKKATKNSETVQEKESSQVKVNKNSKDNKEKQLPKQEKADRSNTEKQNKLQVGTEQEIKQPELFAEELEVKDNEYILPPLSLLQKVQVGSSAGVNQADGDLLEKTLDNFGV